MHQNYLWLLRDQEDNYFRNLKDAIFFIQYEKHCLVFSIHLTMSCEERQKCKQTLYISRIELKSLESNSSTLCQSYQHDMTHEMVYFSISAQETITNAVIMLEYWQDFFHDSQIKKGKSHGKMVYNLIIELILSVILRRLIFLRTKLSFNALLMT